MKMVWMLFSETKIANQRTDTPSYITTAASKYNVLWCIQNCGVATRFICPEQLPRQKRLDAAEKGRFQLSVGVKPFSD